MADTVDLGCSPASSASAAMPERLGSYRLLRRIGAGGMGVVFEARDVERTEHVALKTLVRGGSDNVEALKREFRIAADVHHRNLVDLFELRQTDGQTFFTMELCNGSDLAAYVRAARGEERIARLQLALPQLMDAVDTLHRHGIVHGDLKPANVMVESDGRVVVLDFGVARSLVGGIGGWGGTLAYMSPEQRRGEAAGMASDWFAVGIMLHELLTDGALFQCEDALARFESLPARARPSACGVHAPAEMDELCASLLSVDPVRRRPTAGVSRRAPAPEPRTLPTPLLGRGAELQRLEMRLLEQRARPRVMHLVGQSGIGRSALLDHFVASARARGALTLRGRCREWEAIPYRGLDAAVATMCAWLQEQPNDERRRLVGADSEPAAVLFPCLRPLVGASREGATARDDLDVRDNGARALKRLFCRVAAQRQLVLELDDVQWGDIDGARLLSELLSPPHPPAMLVLLSRRAGEVGPFIGELDTQRAAHGPVYEEETLPIGPLDRDDAVTLAEQLLGGAATPALCGRIVEESGGVPFFVEELSRFCAEAGANRPVPHLGMDELVQARAERLPPTARRLLDVLAVSGRLPSQELAFGIAGLGSGSHAVLHQLRAASLVRTTGPLVSDALEPYHDRVRESIYAALDESRRRELHQAVGEALERQGTEPDVLKFHFARSGDLLRAHSNAVRAADRAFDALAFDRAAEHYRDALTWRPSNASDGARSRLHERLAHSLFNAGRGGEAAPEFLAAAATVASPQALELRRHAALGYLASGRVDDGLSQLRPLMREVGLEYPCSTASAGFSIVRQLSSLWWGLGAGRGANAEDAFRADLCWSAGQTLSMIFPVEGIDLHLRSIHFARRVGDGLRIGRSAIMIGAILINIGGPFARLGEQLLDEARDISEQRGDAYLAGLLLVFRGFCELSGRGRLAIADDAATRGLALLDRCTGVAWERDMARGVIFKAREPAGELDALGDEAAAWMREAVDRGDLYSQAMAAWGVSLHALAVGDPLAAREHMRRVMSRWSHAGYTVQHFHATRMEVLCSLYQGRVDEARERFASEYARMRRIGLHRLALSRIEMDALRALIALADAGGRGIAEAAAIGKRLAREQRIDGQAHGAMVRACIVTHEEKRRERVEGAWVECIAAYERAGMQLAARCAERRRAELTGAAEVVAQVDARLRRGGIADPERWSAVVIPPRARGRA